MTSNMQGEGIASKPKSLIDLPILRSKCAISVVITSLFFAFLVITYSNVRSAPSFNSIFSNQANVSACTLPPPNTTNPDPSPIPRLAYLISGSKGDLDRLWRTFHALYHPRNYYVLHLDLESPVEERSELISRVENSALFNKVKNIHVIEKANLVTYRGPTMVSNTLHACAILLKKTKDWDWFINLSASDYPLMTQDDILHVLSSVPRNTNFIDHTSRLGWKAGQRAQPLIVDPGLYETNKQDIFWVGPPRKLPSAFKLFTGSAWVALTHEFVEYSVWGWDNLPRTLLMYYTNFVSSPEGYFQTLICNTQKFPATVANHDLHFISWDNPPKQHPHSLTMEDKQRMISSNAPFARKFERDNVAVLDAIDSELLGRSLQDSNGFVPGGWCKGKPACSKVGDTTRLKPGPGAQRFAALIDSIVRSDAFQQNQCK